MIKLVASDIDGTLLLNGKRELNRELYDIILELKKRGVVFVAASGRQLENMRKLFGSFADEIFYVAENGAVCQCDQETEVLFEYDRDLAMRIIKEVEKLPDCKLTVSVPTTQYIKSGDKEFYKFMTEFVKYHTTEVDSFEEISEPIIKIAFYNDTAHEESYAYFKQMFERETRVAKAGSAWVDFISYDSNKGTGIKHILEKLQISADEAICFGDQENDVEMMECLGVSYAMEHAKPEVRAHATHTTTSVEETLIELLGQMEE